MSVRSPLILLVSDPALVGRRPSAMRRRAALLATTRLLSSPAQVAGGDGASRGLVPDGPRLVVPDPAAGWRSRVDAAQAEARAALLVPFNRPVTWRPS